MRTFLLSVLLLAGSVAAAPVAESFPDARALDGFSVVERSVATVTICSEPGFKGDCQPMDAFNKCSGNFAYGSIKSIAQDRDVICQYYQDFSCQAGNHSPSKQVDSIGNEYDWADMKDWSGKVLSFKCSSQPIRRAVGASTYLKSRSLGLTDVDDSQTSGA